MTVVLTCRLIAGFIPLTDCRAPGEGKLKEADEFCESLLKKNSLIRKMSPDNYLGEFHARPAEAIRTGGH